MAQRSLLIERISGPQTLTLTSAAFAPSGRIPVKYTADGHGVSPPLAWGDVPAGAKSLVLVVEDPDAPSAQPFVHWVAYAIPAQITDLPEDARRNGLPAGMLQGPNDMGEEGWAGPEPPPTHGPHHYHFELFALDYQPRIGPGARREELARAMLGHVLASGELVGTYARQRMPS